MQRRIDLPLMVLAALTLVAGTAQPVLAQAAPKAPAFVQALPNNGAVLVNWGNVINAVGYNLYRRTADVARDKAALVTPQPFPWNWLIDAGPDGKGLPNGVPLFYSVKAVFKEGDALVEGPASNEVVVTPHPPILGAFFIHDIGTEFPSSVTVEGNVLTVKASGHELWDQNDGGTFIGLPVAGDYTITAKLLDKPKNGHPRSAKGGVMIREGLMPGDRYAFAMVMSGRGVYFEGRIGVLGAEPGAFASEGTDNDATTPPVWLRLTKQGAQISAFQSFDGTNFEQIGETQDFGRMLPVTYVGLGASAVHVNDESLRYVTVPFDASSIKIDFQ